MYVCKHAYMHVNVYIYIYIYIYMCLLIIGQVGLELGDQFCDRKNCSEAIDPWPFWHEPIGRAQKNGVGEIKPFR